MEQSLSRTLKCGICGSEFVCGGVLSFEPCWCTNIAMGREQLRTLAAKTRDCVCPECLKMAAEKSGRE
jgi:hypothetical protein